MSEREVFVSSIWDDSVIVVIKDRRYEYRGNAGQSGQYLADKFNGIARHSRGKALAWLNKNAVGTRIQEEC